MDKQLEITPQTKIGEMLDTYPQLEDVLLSLSPSFAKLKNPILRKTIGRVASLRQAAEIGGINIGEFVATLRKAVGQDDSSFSTSSNGENKTRPDWANAEDTSVTFDASPIIDRGESPMQTILEKAKSLDTGKTMLLIAPFKPVPIIELLESKGYVYWCDENNKAKIYVYLRKR